MRLLSLLVFVLCAGSLFAAISNVNVVGSTNVQGLLSYQAPDNGSCTVEVSADPSLRPLVHDVDPALFPGADSDSRPGSLVDGANRTFAVGKRSVDQASNGKWYSRALQTDTTHYFRIHCGSDTVSGSFHTANISVGITYPWPVPQDASNGNFRWPSLSGNDRTQALIDPNYGTLIRRLSVPGDSPAQIDTLNKPFSSAQGSNWNSAGAALTDDGASATYSGSGRDWLVLTGSALSSLADFYVGSTAIDSVAVRVKGSSSAGSADQRTLEACLTLDGANCAGQVRSVTLDSAQGTQVLGGGPPLDLWGIDPLWPDQVARDKNFGVMLRAGANTTDLSIQYVEADVRFSAMLQMPEAGFWQVCSHTKSNGGYHCTFQDSLSTNHMFWIQPDTGEVRWLGKLITTGWGGPPTLCAGSFAAFDTGDPNVYYCEAHLDDGSAALLKGTYTGNDAAQPPGTLAPVSWVNLTPAGSSIPQLIRQFDPTYDPALYPAQFSFLTSHYAVYKALRQGQDTIGWLAVFDIGNGQAGAGRVVAAAKVYASPPTRWCGIHTTEFVGHTNWIGFDPHSVVSGGTIATGPFQVTLMTALPAQTGAFTIEVSGEPVPYLMDAQAGDTFQLVGGPGWDFLTIVQKLSSTQWIVQRTVTRTDPVARASGTLMNAFCSALQLSIPNQGAYTYWNFQNDPHGQDSTGQAFVVEKQVTGGHIVQRSNARIMESSDGYSVVVPGFPRSLNQPRSYHVTGNPPWSGVQAGNIGFGLGFAYQQHESYENYEAPGGRSNWFVDMIPFAGAFGYTPSLSAVAGTSQVYKYTPTRLNRGVLPTFAVCGDRQLKDISPGPISDQNAYSYCVGNACVQGAADSELYINCPPPVSVKSFCNQTAGGDFSSVCVGDMAPYGQAVTQFFLDSSGARNRVLTNAMYAWKSPHAQVYFDTAYSLPDGSWVVFASYGNNGRKDLYMVKVPQQPDFPADVTAGTGPVTQSISISPPAGSQQVLVSVGNPSGMQPVQPQNCTGGSSCIITVSAKPLDLVLSQAKFLDGSGRQLGGAVQAVVVGGTSGAAIGNPVANSAVNAFSFLPNIAPGTIVSIFGANLANCEDHANALPLPGSLCGASVTFNGQAGPLYYAGPNQINALVPGSIAPGQDVSIVIDRAGSKSGALSFPGAQVGEVAPAMASYSLDGQTSQALVSNSDNSVAGPKRSDLNMRPLHPGETATVWAVGLGPTTPGVPDGQAAPTDPLAVTNNNVDVYVNGTQQKVLFAGLAPTTSGLYQVNFTLDASTPLSANNVIWLRVKGAESPHLPIAIGN